MDGTDLERLTRAGELLFATKLLLTSIQCLWMYDYLLTLGDEVRYAWNGRKSWVFALFIANRYTPVMYIIWLQITMFHYSRPFCESTKWVPVFQSNVTTALAQIAVALRVYAITRENRLIGGTLALQIAGVMCYYIFSVIWVGLGPLQPLPDINLEEFKMCIFKLWTVGELIYYNSAMAFDVLVFFIILITARKQRRHRYPGIPNILDTVVRDATGYFMLIFSVHFLSVLFVFVAPEEIQLFPAMINTILVPVMASRLMLSLKKASAEPEALWTLETMTNAAPGRLPEDGTVRFVSRVPGRLPEITTSRAVAIDGEGVELGITP